MSIKALLYQVKRLSKKVPPKEDPFSIVFVDDIAVAPEGKNIIRVKFE